MKIKDKRRMAYLSLIIGLASLGFLFTDYADNFIQIAGVFFSFVGAVIGAY